MPEYRYLRRKILYNERYYIFISGGILMKKKYLAVGIILLFIAIPFSPAVNTHNASLQKIQLSHLLGSLKNNIIHSKVLRTPLSTTGGNWTQIQKLLASDGVPYMRLGFSVSIDGDTALIGIMNNYNQTGAAYVFTRSSNNWTQQAKLDAPDSQTEGWFGMCVSLQGDTALIGAPCDDNGSGAGYVFTRTGTTWTEQAKLHAPGGTNNALCGFSVALDGNTALLGAPLDNASGILDSGAAYVFTCTGTTWSQQAKLQAPYGAVEDNFGYSVSLSGDTALIGTPLKDDNGDNSGSAYIFTRTNTTWTVQTELLASDGAPYDSFGYSVSVFRDTALVGVPADNDNGPNSGSAYVFTRVGTNWLQQTKLLASDGYPFDDFGASASLTENTALIGAYGKDSGRGSAYIFIRDGTTWSQQAKLIDPDHEPRDMFGLSVSIQDNTALIGAPCDTDKPGAVYVFMNEQPPTAPTIYGPSSGKAKQSYDYTFNSTDQNLDNVYYYVDWGDNTSSDWLGPYSSGVAVTQSHTWTIKGVFTIKTKAKDIYGLESNWSTMSVKMPLLYEPSSQSFFLWLFEWFSHTFPILRHLLR
jgi:hypothetical protein